LQARPNFYKLVSGVRAAGSFLDWASAFASLRFIGHVAIGHGLGEHVFANEGWTADWCGSDVCSASELL